jgi:hypothetical protein
MYVYVYRYYQFMNKNKYIFIITLNYCTGSLRVDCFLFHTYVRYYRGVLTSIYLHTFYKYIFLYIGKV